MTPVIIVGGGPAGIAAAVTARVGGARVTLIDDNPALGGQIWRQSRQQTMDSEAEHWLTRLKAGGAEILTEARVVSGNPDSRSLLVDISGHATEIAYSKLILATGARELFLPFPGWTLPNVMGVGGLQALVKSGMPVAGKRVLVAGSGPLLLAVAQYLRKCGARVPIIAEQASMPTLAAFALSLIAHPGKLTQALDLHPFRGGTHYLTNCWVEAAQDQGRLQSVRLKQRDKRWEVPCDYLANAYGFVPNNELPLALGCAVAQGAVCVDELQRTSVPDIYCAGETTGVGGVDLSLLEGEIAGHAATGQQSSAQALRPRWRRAAAFAKSLNHAFQPRAELAELAQPDTVVCRCEDVTLARLRNANSWRSAKLHERCGMGPCQGRICGPAVQFLFGWEATSVRPPLFPTRLENLAKENSHI